MLSAIFTSEKLFLRLSLLVLAVAASLFVYTGEAIVLAAPLAWLYAILLIHNWKAAWWLFLCLMPVSLRLSFMGNALSLCVPDEPMMWTFLLLFILMAASRNFILKGWWLTNLLVVTVGLQFIWLILSVFYSTVPFFSLKFLLSKTWLLATCFIMPVFVIRSKEDIIVAFRVLLYSFLFTMLIIFLQQARGGFLFSGVNEAIGRLYENHVEYSTLISMFFPAVFVACLWLRGRNKRAFRLMFAIACFFILMIFLSYARAAVLALIFSFVVYFAIRKKLVQWLMPSFYALIALLLVLAIRNDNYLDLRPNYEKTYMNWDFTEHMKATFKGRDESSMERLYRWIAAIRMSQHKPVFGYGPHGFYYNYKTYALRSFRTYASKNREHSTTHNYFLYLLTEQGYPAMILYALLNVFIFARAQTVYHRFRDRFYKLCTMGIAMIFAASFVNNFFSELIDTHKVGALFFISLAMLVILDKKSKDRENALA